MTLTFGSGVVTIFVYKGFDQKSGKRLHALCVFVNIWVFGWVNEAIIVSNKKQAETGINFSPITLSRTGLKKTFFFEAWDFPVSKGHLPLMRAT